MQNVDGKQSTLKPTDKIVICADLDLLEFPLESLKLIHSNAGVGSVSRDFSLQFLSTRINLNKECECECLKNLLFNFANRH